MAINFKRVFWKNFLSTGNAGTELILDRNKTTLVQGVSGAGKSTMIDALCFALYGKPFRSINRPLLVNSVNGKQLEVELEFETNGRQYKIVRGMKPSRFDIICDGKLITQDAAVRDYQNVLEQQILMMTYKTFTQIVILGSTSFTPFMQLATGARREVVEDILDIGIFSTMNQLLKQQMIETKDQQDLVNTEIKTLRERADGLKRLVDTLAEKKDGQVSELRKEYDSVSSQIDAAEKIISSLREEATRLTTETSSIKSLIEKKNAISADITIHEYSKERAEERKNFFNTNNQCPTCEQSIGDDHKHKMVDSISETVEEITSKMHHCTLERDELTAQLSELRKSVDILMGVRTQIKTTETRMQAMLDRGIQISKQIAAIEEESSDIETPRRELKQVAKTVLELVEKKKQLAVQRKLQENASVLLKDSGIKTAIIREYLPLINKLLHKYLTELQMDVEFTLDEQFNEIVKSRYRDEFQYGNFSEGEKLRLDIAILLTWRHIAKVKNSASTNLLVVDEVLSGRLDPSSQDIVVDMINQLSDEGTNVFVIAHQDSLNDKFRSNIRFEKRGNFSVLV